MEVGVPPSCPLPAGPLSELFKGRRSEPEQQALREEMRHRLHPITCRICRQELAYFRDVGRFPLEERDVQGAYLAGRGYRSLLTIWWGRVADHLAGDLKEMPAVSSYYRHMSFHLGVRTEREVTDEDGTTSMLARSGGFATATPDTPSPSPASVATASKPSFPTFIPVPVPEPAQSPAWSTARVEVPLGEPSVLRMARTMVKLTELAERRVPAPRTAASKLTASSSEVLGRAAGTSASTGGYAIGAANIAPDLRKKRAPPRSA
ncbi:MAG: hypothetical protein KGI98_05845 [Euryarchaeota archaeon]|nr:hypothetical protein [Euryarchaeota archaeon]